MSLRVNSPDAHDDDWDLEERNTELRFHFFSLHLPDLRFQLQLFLLVLEEIHRIFESGREELRSVVGSLREILVFGVELRGVVGMLRILRVMRLLVKRNGGEDCGSVRRRMNRSRRLSDIPLLVDQLLLVIKLAPSCAIEARFVLEHIVVEAHLLPKVSRIPDDFYRRPSECEEAGAEEEDVEGREGTTMRTGRHSWRRRGRHETGV